MSQTPPAATVRTHLLVPMRLADGFATTARVFTFNGLVDGREHVAFGLGDRAGAFPSDGHPGSNGHADSNGHPGPNGHRGSPPLVRPHSECLTGDVFGSERCDCAAQMRQAVRQIADTGGFLLYLRQEGRGIGLYPKLDAYALQDAGLDTYEANLALGYAEDQRDYTVAAQMLHALGQSRVALLTNNPDKVRQLRRLGVTVCEQVPTGVYMSSANARYLAAKAGRGGHLFDLPPGASAPRDQTVAGAGFEPA